MTPIDRNVRYFIAVGSGLDRDLVLPGNTSGQGPPDPYVTVLTTSTVRVGYPSYVEHPQTLEVTQRVTRRRTYQVQWYREGSVDRSDRFVVWAESLSGLDVAARLGFAVVNPITVNRADNQVGAFIEERTVANLQIDWVSIVTREEPWVDSISGGLVYDSDGMTRRVEVNANG